MQVSHFMLCNHHRKRRESISSVNSLEQEVDTWFIKLVKFLNWVYLA